MTSNNMGYSLQVQFFWPFQRDIGQYVFTLFYQLIINFISILLFIN